MLLAMQFMSLSMARLSQNCVLRLVFDGSFSFMYNVRSFQKLNGCNHQTRNLFFQKFSTLGAKAGKFGREKPSRLILQGNLERALHEHHVSEAWEAYKDFKSVYGFPDQFLVSSLITESSYSADSKFLRMSSELVLSLSKEKRALLRPDMMTKLVISLARAQIPVPASRVLRQMLDKRNLPSLDVLNMVFLHLVKTETGTYLASNILMEICDCFQKLKKSAQTEFTKPDVTIFNLVLDACVRFGSSFKGKMIMELMPQVGVVADAHTVVIIARLQEINGMRDELKKFKDYIDKVPVTLAHHYQPFYDCLLSLYFKFNDIDAAAALLVDLANPSRRDHMLEQQKSCSVSIGSDNIKTGSRLQFLPDQLQKDLIYKVDSKPELLVYKNGKFVLSNKGLAKLILGYKRHGRIYGLAKVLVSIQNMLSSEENKDSCSDVIDACIHLGWIETAHDILEDLGSEKYHVRVGSYASLLTTYYDKDMVREAEALLRQIQRTGLVMMFSDEMAFSSFLSKSKNEKISYLKDLSSSYKTDLATSIVQNIREEEKRGSSLVHDYNSSIYFFTTAKMMEDAQRTYRKMQEMRIFPTATTYFHLICGYSSLGMYREIAHLWGDIKRSTDNRKSLCSRDLYELLLINFLRGGYFERVMEIIGLMVENHMYLDKWSYKTEFLKFHRDLYRALIATDAKNEAQRKRIEHVQAFRKLVGTG